MGSLRNFVTSNNHSNNWEYASNLLKAKHETLYREKKMFSEPITKKTNLTAILSVRVWERERGRERDRERYYYNAIITLCCLNVELILQQKAGRSHRIPKAQAYLENLGEFLLDKWRKSEAHTVIPEWVLWPL